MRQIAEKGKVLYPIMSYIQRLQIFAIAQLLEILSGMRRLGAGTVQRRKRRRIGAKRVIHDAECPAECDVGIAVEKPIRRFARQQAFVHVYFLQIRHLIQQRDQRVDVLLRYAYIAKVQRRIPRICRDAAAADFLRRRAGRQRHEQQGEHGQHKPLFHIHPSPKRGDSTPGHLFPSCFLPQRAARRFFSFVQTPALPPPSYPSMLLQERSSFPNRCRMTIASTAAQA